MAFDVEVPHTYFTEVTWVVFVEVDTVVMLTTGVTTTTWMLAMFAYTTVAMAYMAAQFSGFTKSGRLYNNNDKEWVLISFAALTRN